MTESEKTARIAKTKESLKYEFSDRELLEISRNLARSHQDLDQLTDAKDKAMADFKAQIQSTENQINDLSRRINNGYEYRSIECELRYHAPSVGQKTLVRLDTNTIVGISDMDGWEMQEVLFPADPLDDILPPPPLGKRGKKSS